MMPEETLDEKVQYQDEEPLVFKVTRSLRQRNFEVAQFFDGSYSETYGTCKIVSSASDEQFSAQSCVPLHIFSRKKGLLGLLWQPFLYIGKMRIFSTEYTSCSEWDFSVYGKCYVPHVMATAKELAEEYRVKVRVHLENEEPKFIRIER